MLPENAPVPNTIDIVNFIRSVVFTVRNLLFRSWKTF